MPALPFLPWGIQVAPQCTRFMVREGLNLKPVVGNGTLYLEDPRSDPAGCCTQSTSACHCDKNILMPAFSPLQDCEREGDQIDKPGGQLPGGLVALAPAFPVAAHSEARPLWALPVHCSDLHRWEPTI